METKYNILIVDDEEAHREWFEEIFTDFGHTVHTANDGMGALAVLKKGFQADCIVTDVNMPQMDGNELCQRIKSEQAFTEIPIIMVTGNLSPEEEKKGYASGVSKYILKTRIADEDTISKPVLNCCKDYQTLKKIKQRLHYTTDLVKKSTISERADQWIFDCFTILKPDIDQALWCKLIFHVLKQRISFDGGIMLHLDGQPEFFYTEGSNLSSGTLNTYRAKGPGRHVKEPYTAIVTPQLSILGGSWPAKGSKKELQLLMIESFIEKVCPIIQHSLSSTPRELESMTVDQPPDSLETID